MNEATVFLCAVHGETDHDDVRYALVRFDDERCRRVLGLMDEAGAYNDRFGPGSELRLEHSEIRWCPYPPAPASVRRIELWDAVNEAHEGFFPVTVGPDLVELADVEPVQSTICVRENEVKWETDPNAGARLWISTITRPMVLGAWLRAAPPEERPEIFRELASRNGRYALKLLEAQLVPEFGEGEPLALTDELGPEHLLPLSTSENDEIRRRALELFGEVGRSSRGRGPR